MNYKLEKIGILRRHKPIYSRGEIVAVGSSVKLIFKLTDKNAEVNAERLWISVKHIDGKDYVGTVDNDPLHVDLKYGDKISFLKDNIFDINNGHQL